MRYLVLSFMVLGFLSCAPQKDAPPSIKALCQNKKVVVGGLFGLGEKSTDPFTPAMNLCRDRSKASLAGTGFSVEIQVVDTQNDPEKTLAGLNDMITNQGVNIIVGPDDSESALYISKQAEANDMIFISPSATDKDIAGTPNVFSLAPSDTYQGKLLAQLMRGLANEKPSKIVGIHRGLSRNPDAYAIDLREAIRDRLPGVDYQWLGYDHTDLGRIDTIFFNDSVIPELTGTATTTPIMLIAFSADGTAVLKTAANYEKANPKSLSQHPWFASDGLALSRDLLADQDAAGFAAGVKLRVTVFDFPNDTPMYIDFEKAIMAPPYNAALPNVYSATTYDACILAVKAAKAIYDQGCPGSVNWDDTVTSLSAETEGVTGLLTVDDRGIRTAKNYAVWGLTREKPYAWKQEQSCIYEDSSKDSSEPFKCGTAH